MKCLERSDLLSTIEKRLRTDPVVLLLGPRQCGKTTLARQFANRHNAHYIDLESPAGLNRLAQPMTALAPLRGRVVIDEAQLQPALFPSPSGR